MSDRWRNAVFTVTIVHGDLEEPTGFEPYGPFMDELADLADRHFPGRFTIGGRLVEVIDGDPVEEIELMAAAKELLLLVRAAEARWMGDDDMRGEVDRAALRLRDAIGRVAGASWFDRLRP